MRSMAWVFGWEMWSKNRSGIVALGLCLFGLAVSCGWLSRSDIREPILPLSVIVFALGSLYLTSIVACCEFRDDAQTFGFPARMFRLPVTTRTLVTWPMLYGIVALVLFWGAMSVLVWWPAGIEPKGLYLPLFAVVLVWVQAICWAVPGSPLTKILAAGVILPSLKFALEMIAIGVSVFVYDERQLDRATYLARGPMIVTVFSGCFLPLAYVIALRGVACDRRGTLFGAGLLRQWWDRIPRWLPTRRAPFKSAMHAQLWFEWRGRGLVLPMYPASILVFLSVVVAPFVGARQLLQPLLFLTAAVPVVAFFVGYGLGKNGFWSEDLSLSALQATQPVTNATMASVKLLTAAVSALVTWALLFVTIPVWLMLLGKYDDAIRVVAPYFRDFSSAQICLIGAIGFCSLFALTWGQLVGGLCLSLTGRTWVVNVAVALYLILLVAGIWSGRWIYTHPDQFATSLQRLWWCACGCLGVKVVAAGWALFSAHRRQQLEWRSVGILFGIWCLGAGCLVTLAYLWLPSNGLPIPTSTAGGSINRIPIPLVALGAVLMLPLVRLTAAPLAVAWNRHR